MIRAKLNSKSPEDIINFINLRHPEFRGKIYYDERLKELVSNDRNIEVYFDPIHAVLEIKYHTDS